jgi:D-beta-D-heptose 7-phosphate kinase/D-beta-D-heptose 1-phosphate adenosyltransferase
MKKIYRDAAAVNRELTKHPEKTIVFTNGVFDILHAGHIELLEFAKAEGDLLIVGINDDASVKRLKGDKRPIFSLEERTELLEAVQYVDYIIPFAEDTPLQLIQALTRIDVLVKGGDYQPHQVVGRKEVEKAGGRLCLFTFQSQMSTSDIIQRITA